MKRKAAANVWMAKEKEKEKKKKSRKKIPSLKNGVQGASVRDHHLS
jgi:hypothetical protein